MNAISSVLLRKIERFVGRAHERLDIALSRHIGERDSEAAGDMQLLAFGSYGNIRDCLTKTLAQSFRPPLPVDDVCIIVMG